MSHRRHPNGPRFPDSLQTALETLRRAPDGAALLAQIERGRDIQNDLTRVVERGYFAFLQNMLDRYKRRAGLDTTTRLKVNLIAHHAAHMAELPDTGDPAAGDLAVPDDEALRQHLTAMLWASSEATLREARTDANTDGPPRETGAHKPAEYMSLIQTLARSLDEAMIHSADNAVRLKIIARTLECASTEDELEDAQELFNDGVFELLRDNEVLDDRLQRARYHINELALQLTAPGSYAVVCTDRDTLMQRLETEAQRAQRYGHPLSLALLDPDHLSEIDRLVGPNAGREVVRRYLDNVTTCARKYDVIAPCQPHGLAWLLPGTKTDQGLRALHKMQRQVADSQYEYGGRLRPLPTFSGAVIGYAAGEKPAAFLARAETLIARARSAGPNRIEAETT